MSKARRKGQRKPVVGHPTFDKDGYPTEETLLRIRTWPCNDLPALWDYVREAWSEHGRIWQEDGLTKMATGGWSGNETVAAALEEQRIFWALYWDSSHRGGLDCFRLPNAPFRLPGKEEQ